MPSRIVTDRELLAGLKLPQSEEAKETKYRKSGHGQKRQIALQ